MRWKWILLAGWLDTEKKLAALMPYYLTVHEPAGCACMHEGRVLFLVCFLIDGLTWVNFNFNETLKSGRYEHSFLFV